MSRHVNAIRNIYEVLLQEKDLELTVRVGRTIGEYLLASKRYPRFHGRLVGHLAELDQALAWVEETGKTPPTEAQP